MKVKFSAFIFTITSVITCFLPPYVMSYSGELMLTSGYRLDEFRNTIHIYEPSSVFIGNDTLKAREINSFQLGLKGRGEVCNFMLRFNADYAWLGDGQYTESTDFPPVPENRVKAGLKNGDFQDFTIGVGYYFQVPCVCNFEVAPIVGWSYHRQKFKINHTREKIAPSIPSMEVATGSGSSSFETISFPSPGDISVPVLNGVSFKNRWEGPWLGIDFVYDACPFKVYAGYEYHWATWHADWKLAGPDVQTGAFSDKRHSKCAHGQVAYLDSEYELCSNWIVGLGLKFNYWVARHGKERPIAGSFSSIGLPSDEHDHVNRAIWRCVTVTLDLGYAF